MKWNHSIKKWIQERRKIIFGSLSVQFASYIEGGRKKEKEREIERDGGKDLLYWVSIIKNDEREKEGDSKQLMKSNYSFLLNE